MQIGAFDPDRIARDVSRTVNDVARGAERAVGDVAAGAETMAHDLDRGAHDGLDAVGRSIVDAERLADRASEDATRTGIGAARELFGFVAGAGNAIADGARTVASFTGAALDWVGSGIVDFFVKQPRELATLREGVIAANQGDPAQRFHGTSQDVRDYFDLTSVTYDSSRRMPDGWTEVTDAEARLGVPLEDPESGLRARVFQQGGTIVLVFEGTRLTSIEDWETNIPQGLGTVPPQYRQALDVALRFRQEFGDEGDLVVTGHSLGGGLATFAGVGAGIETYTFHPSGLGPDSKVFLESLGLVDQNQHLVKNFIQSGDVQDELRIAQWFVMPGTNLVVGGSFQTVGEIVHVGDLYLNPIEAHLDPDLDDV